MMHETASKITLPEPPAGWPRGRATEGGFDVHCTTSSSVRSYEGSAAQRDRCEPFKTEVANNHPRRLNQWRPSLFMVILIVIVRVASSKAPGPGPKTKQEQREERINPFGEGVSTN